MWESIFQFFVLLDIDAIEQLFNYQVITGTEIEVLILVNFALWTILIMTLIGLLKLFYILRKWVF